MNILIACECSGIIRNAFRKKGHNAWSCDLKPQEGNEGGYHLQGDVRWWLNDPEWKWDMMIAHPDCTYLTNSAAWAYKEPPYHQKVKPETLTGQARRQARQEAIEFAETLWDADIEKVVIENPAGYLSTMSKLGKPSQIIQPYEYGDNASKRTCLWIRNLPLLKPTKYYPPRIVNGKKRWGNQTDSGQNKLTPNDNRAAKRAQTYQGWADAMADQWG